MIPAAARRYTQAQRETASPERLLVLLFEAALRHVRAGIAALDAKRPADAVTPLTKASDIVVELHATLDRTKAPELCDQLAELYRFVCLRLNDAALRKDARAARDAERALAPVADAFAQAVQKTAGAR